MSKWLIHPAMLTSLVALAVGSPARAEPKFFTKVYSVHELIAETDPHKAPSGLSAAVQACFRVTEPKPIVQRMDGRSLVRFITDSIAMESWKLHGGKGTLNYYPIGRALVATQTTEVHDRIADLLVTMRELCGHEVSVEVRLISMPVPATEAMAARLRQTDNRMTPHGPVFLSPEAMAEFMADVQTTPRTNVMALPRVVMDPAQEARLQCSLNDPAWVQVRQAAQAHGLPCAAVDTDEPTGLNLLMRSEVSDDRRYLRLDLHGRLRVIDWSQSIKAGCDTPVIDEKNLTGQLILRDGCSVVLGGWVCHRPDGEEPVAITLVLTGSVTPTN